MLLPPKSIPVETAAPLGVSVPSNGSLLVLRDIMSNALTKPSGGVL